MYKECKKCKTTKPVSLFYKSNHKKHGVEHKCKTCFQESRRSLDNHFRNCYNKAQYRVKNYSTYKGREHTLTWEQWLTFKPKYAELHKQWVEKGYKKTLTPSVDRIDNLKGYTFDNIQIITHSENVQKDGSGEKSPLAKLTEADVMAIMALKKVNRKLTQIKLAKMFGVKQGTISAIFTKRSWWFVPTP